MHVMVGLRRRFCTFCDLALVSKATAPSRNPYHMATAWMVLSWLIEHRVMVWRPVRYSSTSSGLILMSARCLTPWPMAVDGWSVMCLLCVVQMRRSAASFSGGKDIARTNRSVDVGAEGIGD